MLRLDVYFHAKGFARILVSKQRHKLTRKWLFLYYPFSFGLCRHPETDHGYGVSETCLPNSRVRVFEQHLTFFFCKTTEVGTGLEYVPLQIR